MFENASIINGITVYLLAIVDTRLGQWEQVSITRSDDYHGPRGWDYV